MLAPTRSRCPRCGREPSPADHSCALCGQLLGPVARPAAPDPAPAEPPPPRSGPPAEAVSVRPSRTPAFRPRGGSAEPWLFLGVGALIAPVFLLPLPAWIGWYFSALVHEMGHAGAAWFLGCPALPALGVGEAVTVEAARVLPLTAVIWTALVVLAWRAPGLQGSAGHRDARGSWVRWVGLGAAGLAYPLVAFTSAGELAKLVAGHAAELAFAALALWRAMTGGFTSSAAERGLYSVLGWYLVADNLRLTGGLMTSASARAEYASNGSFGCVNDYIRVADRWLGGSLEGVALLATLAALTVVPLALAARRWLVAAD